MSQVLRLACFLAGVFYPRVGRYGQYTSTPVPATTNRYKILSNNILTGRKLILSPSSYRVKSVGYSDSHCLSSLLGNVKKISTLIPLADDTCLVGTLLLLFLGYWNITLCLLQSANNVFLSHQTSTSHQLLTSQQYFSFTPNQPLVTVSRTRVYILCGAGVWSTCPCA